MNCSEKSQTTLLILLGTMLLVGTLSCECVYGSSLNKEYFWQSQLRENGYQTDTAEDIISATKSSSYFIRHVALDLLTRRYPQEAMPALKQSLNDKEIVVRCAAAHLLGTLGDKSGLKQMQKDFEAFAPKEEEFNDPNILRDPNALEQRTKNHRYRILTALEIGKVLAELGDFRAYNLAVKEGLSDANKSGTITIRAAEVLGEIGKKDVNELKTQGMEPIAVLCKMAETEKEWGIFHAVESIANEIGGKATVQIYEKAAINPNISKEKIDITKMVLTELKEKAEPNTPP